MRMKEPNLEIEQIFLRMPCCIWWIDRNHNVLGCNIETCAAFRAYSPEEILGKTILEIANGKDLSEFKAKLIYDSDEHIMKSGVAEYQIKNMVPHHITESPKKQLGAKQPIFNTSGEVIGLVCVVLFDHDVNNEFKKDFEHQKLEVERFKLDIKVDSYQSKDLAKLGFKEIIDMAPCSIWWMDRNHIYLGCNKECCNIVEVNCEAEMIGEDIFDICKRKKMLESNAKNIYDLDEFIMRNTDPIFNIENIVSQRFESPMCQWAAKKAILNNNNESIGLLGAGIYNGLFANSKK